MVRFRSSRAMSGRKRGLRGRARYGRRSLGGMRRSGPKRARSSVRNSLPGSTSMVRSKYVRRARKGYRLLKYITNPITYTIQDSSHLEATEGSCNLQAYGVFDAEDIAKLYQTVQDQDPSTTPSSLFLDGANVTARFVNNSVATMSLEIFEIVRIRDSNHFGEDVAESPVDAFRDGLQKEDIAFPATSKAYTMPDIPLEDSVMFKQYFRVTRRVRVNLSQGAAHVHQMRVVLNKRYSDAMETLGGQEGQDFGLAGYDKAGFARYLTYRIHGFPIMQTGLQPPLVNGPTIANVSLDMQISIRYTFRRMIALGRIIKYEDNLLNAGAPANEQVLSAGAGDLVTNKIT